MAFPLSTQRVKSQTVRRSKASLERGSFTVLFVLFLISFLFQEEQKKEGAKKKKKVSNCMYEIKKIECWGQKVMWQLSILRFKRK